MAKALPVGAILKSGWAAFAKAPFLFIGFTLLGGALNLGSQFVQDQASKSIQDGSGLGLAWILIFLLGFSLNIVASLWLNIGLFRGAWRALGGEKPIFKDFVNWHGKSITRLFMMTLFLVAVNMVVLAIALLAGGLLSLIRLELLFIPLVIAVFTMIYLAVTQMFHVPLVVARGDKPMLAFKEGRRSVDPQFWPVFGFGILMILIGLTGLLLCGVGILVAAPVIVCCLVAAYQHLFDSEDQTGFLINLSKG